VEARIWHFLVDDLVELMPEFDVVLPAKRRCVMGQRSEIAPLEIRPAGGWFEWISLYRIDECNGFGYVAANGKCADADEHSVGRRVGDAVTDGSLALIARGKEDDLLSIACGWPRETQVGDPKLIYVH
jgi:hypothetical protein